MFARNALEKTLAALGFLVAACAASAAPTTLPPDLEAALAARFDGIKAAHGTLFETLDPNDYRHPYERKVVGEIMKDPKVLELLPEATEIVAQVNKEYHRQHLMQGVLCSPTQFPEIYAMAQENAAALKMKPGFKVYVMNSAQMNAYTWSIDQDNYGVALFSGLIRALSPDELRFVLAHEMGHVKSKHVLTGVLLQLYAKKHDALPKVLQASATEDGKASEKKAMRASPFETLMDDLPADLATRLAGKLGGGIRPLMVTEAEEANFQRLGQAQEYSSDRAGIVATAKRKESMMGLVKLSSGDMGKLEGFDLDAYLAQVEAVLADMTSEELKNLMAGEGSHAFTIMRVGELDRFYAGSEYQDAASTQGTSVFTRIVSAYFQVGGDLAAAALKLKKFQEGTGAEEMNALERRMLEKKLTEAVTPRLAAVEALAPAVLETITGLGLAGENPAFELFAAYLKAKKTGKPVEPVLAKLVEALQFALQEPDLTPDQKATLEARLATTKALKKLGSSDDDDEE